MGAVATALTALQTALAAPGGTTVATDAYTVSIAAAGTAKSAIATAIASNEAEIEPTPAVAWHIAGDVATLSGAVVAGQTFTLTVNGTRFSYTAADGDPISLIVTTLWEAIILSGLSSSTVDPLAGSITIPGAIWMAGGVAFAPFSIPPVTLGGVLSAPLAATALIAAEGTTGALASLTAARGYVGRIATNLANAST